MRLHASNFAEMSVMGTSCLRNLEAFIQGGELDPPSVSFVFRVEEKSAGARAHVLLDSGNIFHVPPEPDTGTAPIAT